MRILKTSPFTPYIIEEMAKSLINLFEILDILDGTISMDLVPSTILQLLLHAHRAFGHC